MAAEQRDRNCPTRSSSLRSCARPDPRQSGRAGAIAVKYSARASREMPWRRKSQQTRAHDLLNARTCSLRCQLVTAPRTAQAISVVWRGSGSVPSQEIQERHQRQPDEKERHGPLQAFNKRCARGQRENHDNTGHRGDGVSRHFDR